MISRNTFKQMRHITLFMILLLVGCSSPQTNNEAAPKIPEPSEQLLDKPTENTEIDTPQAEVAKADEPIKKQYTNLEIKSFHYQLQSTIYEELLDLDVDLLILDPDDSDIGDDELLELRGRMTVLAYLSIGEAESYRDYWQDQWRPGNPGFLDKENPNWKSNFKVRYWFPDWQNIIINYVNRLIQEGWDGVYLDTIDAYEYFDDPDSKNEMIQFVKTISDTTKSQKGDFLIVPQNGIALYDKYADYVDGVGKEDTWYNDNTHLEDEDINTELTHLRVVRDQGKMVLMTDYPDKNVRVCKFYEYCEDEEFACFVSERDLDQHEATECQ